MWKQGISPIIGLSINSSFLTPTFSLYEILSVKDFEFILNLLSSLLTSWIIEHCLQVQFPVISSLMCILFLKNVNNNIFFTFEFFSMEQRLLGNKAHTFLLTSFIFFAPLLFSKSSSLSQRPIPPTVSALKQFFPRFFSWDFTFSFPVALNICFYGVPMETGYLNVSVFKRHLADAHMWMSMDAHKHHTCTFCSYLHANHQYNSEHCPG